MNYMIVEAELLDMVYDFEKVSTNLLGTKVIICIDQATIQCLMDKKKTKPCLIQWILLL